MSSLLNSLFSDAQQIFPPAFERRLESFDRRDQYVQFAGFDFLNGADVQFCQVSELLLGHVQPGANLLDVRPNAAEKLLLLGR